MRMIRTGDPCPICGRPVATEDPEALACLSAIAQLLERFGVDSDINTEEGEEHDSI